MQKDKSSSLAENRKQRTVRKLNHAWADWVRGVDDANHDEVEDYDSVLETMITYYHRHCGLTDRG